MTQKQFEKAFKEVLEKYNISYYKEYDITRAVVKTILGDLQIGLHEGWISMRFISDDFKLEKFYEIFSELEGVNHTFKWNIHLNEKGDCIAELEDRLDFLMNK
jgi:hypothetical protein